MAKRGSGLADRRPAAPPRPLAAAPTWNGAIARRKRAGPGRPSAAASAARPRSAARSLRRDRRRGGRGDHRLPQPPGRRTTSPRGRRRGRSRAGCTGAEHRPDLSRHNPTWHPGDDHVPDPPATSGKHSGAQPPDEPKVSDAPFDETLAVHALEHGGVFIYYRPTADGGSRKR